MNPSQCMASRLRFLRPGVRCCASRQKEIEEMPAYLAEKTVESLQSLTQVNENLTHMNESLQESWWHSIFCRILFQSFFGSPKLEQERFSCPEISWSADCVQEAGETLHQKSDGKDQRSTWFGGLSPSIRKHMQCIDLRVGASEQFNLSDVDHEDQPYSTVRCIVVATNHSNIDCFLINIVSWWWHQRRRQRKTKMKNMKEMLTNWACDGDDSR